MNSVRNYFNELCLVFKSAPSNDLEAEGLTEELEARFYAVHGINNDDVYMRRVVDGLRAEQRGQLDSRVLSDSPGGEAQIIRNAATEIEAAMERRGLACAPMPYFAIFNTNVVNAYAIRVPSSDDIIVAFDSGALQFFYMMSTFAALLLPVVDQNGGFECSSLPEPELDSYWANHISGRPDLLQYCLLSSLAYVWNLSREIMWLPHFGGPGRFHIATSINAGTRLFLLGHEYGHILAGHFKSATTKRFSALSGNTVKVIESSWVREFEADAWAANLAVGAYLAGNRYLNWAVLSLDFFFASLQRLETLRDISSGKTVSGKEHLSGFSDTHPPLELRRSHFWNCLRSLFPKDAIDSCEKTCRFLDAGMRIALEKALADRVPLLLDRGEAREFVRSFNMELVRNNPHWFVRSTVLGNPPS
jgi:hypothetical protein